MENDVQVFRGFESGGLDWLGAKTYRYDYYPDSEVGDGLARDAASSAETERTSSEMDVIPDWETCGRYTFVAAICSSFLLVG